MWSRRRGLAAWSMLAVSSAACISEQISAPSVSKSTADFSAAAVGQLAPVSWSVRRSAPNSFRAAAAAADAERIYVFGGDAGSSTPTTTTRIYHPSSNTWTAGASFTGGRDFAVAAALPDGLHLVGGAGLGGLLSDHSVYVPGTNTWMHL